MASWWFADRQRVRSPVLQAEQTETQRQSLRFLLLYGLAVAGGAVAYVPFLTLLLPLRATEMAAGENIDLLAYIAFGGAITASLGAIAFGWLSDITRTRRPWIVAGLVLSSALLVSMRQAEESVELIALIVIWQIALNMMLAPLAAWGGDLVPDRQKGLLGGLLAFAPALGAASGALVTIPGLAGPDARLTLVACLVAATVLPVILFGSPRPMPHLMVAEPKPAARSASLGRGMVGRMWLGRLLVQIAEAALFAYLLIWLVSLDASFTDSMTARIFAVVLACSVPLAMIAGRWSDQHDRPIVPLALGAGIGTAGLVVMSIAHDTTGAIAGYVLFGISTSVFLALHSSQTLRVLPQPSTRGRDLGLFNLTNTVPSLIMPWIALGIVPRYGFDAFFLVLAGLAALATLLLATMPRPN